MDQHDTREAPAAVATPEFAIAWEEPGDEQRFWQVDRMHYPEPITLLDDNFIRVVYRHGFNRAAAHYELPIRAAARRIGTYHYSSMAPNVPPEEMEAQGKRAEERITPAIADLGELWDREWLPEIQRYLAEWRAFDLSGATGPELLTHLDRTTERTERIWEIHFLVAFPMLLSISLFDDFYRDLFGEQDAFQAYRLLQGFDNKTLETNRAMWELSRRALAEPTVRQIFETLPAGEVVAALGGTAAGQAFLAELRAFLDQYGRRGDTWGFRCPGWIEEPTSVIRTLKDYVAQPDRDLAAERATLVAERERLVAETRERLAGYPRPVVEQFEGLLKSAQVGNVLSEEHGFWIDFSSAYEVRLVILEIGRRFAAAGVIEQPEEVFYLSLDEIRATDEAPALDRRAVIAERRAEMERFAVMSPPPVLGTPPSGSPPQDPIGRAIMKMFGGGPPPPSDEPTELRGSAGSPGTVSGPVRVVRSLDEADRVQPGDVLVAEFTAPPWTSLFATVAAVITDAGGILSHCAVVAREYGIPAVVGTGRAMATLRDGQLVEVDGDAGLVRILD